MTEFTYFKNEEFNCPCCGENEMLLDFVEHLDLLRGNVGVPFYVNSGYRCDYHNAMIKGAKNSYHKYGLAADIRTDRMNSTTLHKLIQLATESGFNIGIEKTYVHLDMREFHELKDGDEIIPKLWVY